MEKKIRVLIAKPGLDGHDRGAKVVARAFKDAGLEVIYTGLHQTPDQIVNAAVQEDVNLIGLSILSGAHLGLTEKVFKKLQAAGCEDKALVIGGVIPVEDIEKLKEIGAVEVFPQWTTPSQPVEFVTKFFNLYK